MWIPDLDGMSDTIFVFLTLKTASLAHYKIFGAKFLSFEHASIAYWCTVGYAAKKRNMQWMTVKNMHQRGTIEPVCHSNTASIVIRKEPLLPSNSGCNGRQERLFWYIMGSKTMQNHAKTARQISKTDFYFVTCFYRLYDICICFFFTSLQSSCR